MVFDTVIPPGCSNGLESVIGLIVIVIGFIPRCCIPIGTSVTTRSRVGGVGFVRNENTHLNGEGNPFGLVPRSVTNVVVFDTVMHWG